jgi:phage host-nuclease inhibitor protein Gam
MIIFNNKMEKLSSLPTPDTLLSPK